MLLEAQRDAPRIGAHWILPGVRNPRKPVHRTTMAKWFRRAIRLAGIEVAPRTGYHSLRRKFATELKHVPLPDLAALGGWQDAKTILMCYQSPDEATMPHWPVAPERPPGRSNGHGRDTGRKGRTPPGFPATGKSLDSTAIAVLDRWPSG